MLTSTREENWQGFEHVAKDQLKGRESQGPAGSLSAGERRKLLAVLTVRVAIASSLDSA